MSDIVYKKSALTGGATNALDGVDGADLTSGTLAFTLVSDVLYIHRVNAASSDAENSPHIITPDTNPGTCRWELMQLIQHSADVYTEIKNVLYPPDTGVTDYGAASGADYAAHNIAWALSAVGTDAAELHLPAATYDFATAVDFSAATGLLVNPQKGALMKPGSGVNLTFGAGQIPEAIDFQIFDLSAGGTVSGLNPGHPEWFGDTDSDINDAIDSTADGASFKGETPARRVCWKFDIDLTTPANKFTIYTVPTGYSYYPLITQARFNTAISATTGDYWGIGVDAANQRVDMGVDSTAASGSAFAKNQKITHVNLADPETPVATAGA